MDKSPEKPTETTSPDEEVKETFLMRYFGEYFFATRSLLFYFIFHFLNAILITCQIFADFVFSTFLNILQIVATAKLILKTSFS